MTNNKRRRSPAAIKQARRKLIRRLFRACQLDLFTDRSTSAANALRELKDGLAQPDAELQQCKRA
jgi:hypothetical protein